MEMKARLELRFAVWLKDEAPIPLVVLGQTYDLPSSLPAVGSRLRDTLSELLVSGGIQQSDKPEKRFMLFKILQGAGAKNVDQGIARLAFRRVELALENCIAFQTMPRISAAAFIQVHPLDRILNAGHVSCS